MDLRKEFVLVAMQEGANKRALCRRYGISPDTGYKWLNRYRAEQEAGLQDRTRAPQRRPTKTDPTLEQQAMQVRQQHPTWGGRKIRRHLLNQGVSSAPAASTLTAIFRRHQLLDSSHRTQQSWQRFEHEAPNDLWQMDFKGHFPLQQGRCHPLTILDDHSRFNLALRACAFEQQSLVQSILIEVFRRYGLPYRFTVDQGHPWGSGNSRMPHTALSCWLMRLGIRVSYSRPYHPQTQGKDERFHRTLKADLLTGRTFRDLRECQQRFEAWRHEYNCVRPHEALDLEVPARRYQPSARTYPETLPPIEYRPDDLVRTVQASGDLSFKNRLFSIGKAFRRQPIALRPTETDGVWQVYFCYTPIKQLDLRSP